MERTLVGSLNKRGVPEKGTRLNWLNMPLGTRLRPMKWILQGENYYNAVDRVRIEAEIAEMRRTKEPDAPRLSFIRNKLMGMYHLTQPTRLPEKPASSRITPRDVHHGHQQL